MAADRRHLFVAGLADEVDEEVLRAAFIPFGPVLSVELPDDAATQKHRGFGFVQFEDAEDAAEAIDNMHMAELFGSVLKVNVAKPDRSRGKGGSGAVWESQAYVQSYLLNPDAKPAELEAANAAPSTE
ncbi:uncharacterized protein AMSG_05947 [Thecamonas trahens ATCC 50062]|uniref:RRM domain-containing protein n=1 Tax=Thecamonas trahens ATCC 50062 TaxID=461836 RepID=A0A0L0DC77_THETB|nr:hypothetical protein AMSG_05947 [Thecamonas trahens ATCC 50062]KNC49686.1 hypothetical protein AMSG_05947 [Thecamonas trahens ATCC 50062]|eukprot:XP_013757482.1 hypothetical protein AMSG_05947 [Thecamonas trahens ATCC 50062]